MLGVIIFRESKVEIEFITWLVADDAIFEARNKGVGTKSQGVIFGGATFKRLAVFLTGKINDDFVTLLCGALYCLFLGVGFSNSVENFFNFGLFNLNFIFFNF